MSQDIHNRSSNDQQNQHFIADKNALETQEFYQNLQSRALVHDSTTDTLVSQEIKFSNSVSSTDAENLKKNELQPKKRRRTNYKLGDNLRRLDAAVRSLIQQQQAGEKINLKGVAKTYDVPYNTLRDNFLRTTIGRVVKNVRNQDNEDMNSQRPTNQAQFNHQSSVHPGYHRMQPIFNISPSLNHVFTNGAPIQSGSPTGNQHSPINNSNYAYHSGNHAFVSIPQQLNSHGIPSHSLMMPPYATQYMVPVSPSMFVPMPMPTMSANISRNISVDKINESSKQSTDNSDENIADSGMSSSLDRSSTRLPRTESNSNSSPKNQTSTNDRDISDKSSDSVLDKTNKTNNRNLLNSSNYGLSIQQKNYEDNNNDNNKHHNPSDSAVSSNTNSPTNQTALLRTGSAPMIPQWDPYSGRFYYHPYGSEMSQFPAFVPFSQSQGGMGNAMMNDGRNVAYCVVAAPPSGFVPSMVPSQQLETRVNSDKETDGERN